jgi:transcription elongation factor GreA
MVREMAISTGDSARRIRIGSRVRLHGDDGEAEVSVVAPEDAEAVAGRISTASPLGRALLGREAGDRVPFRAPAGELVVTVVSVG